MRDARVLFQKSHIPDKTGDYVHNKPVVFLFIEKMKLKKVKFSVVCQMNLSVRCLH